MKEMIQRAFVIENAEFKRKIGIPENAVLTNVELRDDGSITLLCVGEKQ